MYRWWQVAVAATCLTGCFPAEHTVRPRVRGAGSVTTYEPIDRNATTVATATVPRDPLVGRIGAREMASPITFALDAATLAGRDVRALAAATTGPALVDLARATNRFRDGARASGLSRGDLLVFDGAVDRAPASLLGVVVGEERPGTWSFVYLAEGIIRRGLITPGHPAAKRGADGAALNTHLRHRETRRPTGTRFLAGELFAGVIGPIAR